MNALTILPPQPHPRTSWLWISLFLLVGLTAFITLPIARGAAAMLLGLLPLVGLYALSQRQLMAISLFTSAALLLSALSLWHLDAISFKWAEDGFLAVIASAVTLVVGSITSELNQSQMRRHEHHQALKQTLENLHQQATKDLQTGLPNQAYMRAWISQAAKRSQRSGQPMCLALLARDDTLNLIGSKAVNAEVIAPDELAFEQWVSCANQVFRENDVIARWSSEELLVLFEGSAPEQAKEGLSRLRQATSYVAFSSGLLVWQAIEPIDDAIHRLRAGLQLQQAHQKGGQQNVLV